MSATLRRALALRAGGDRPAAMAAYEEVLRLDPRCPEALLGLAALAIQSGDPARALPLLERCCRLEPGRAEAWDALGVALLLVGETCEAHEAFGEAARLDPAVIDYALHRAEAAVASGRVAAERADLEAALARDPADAAALAGRALLAERDGDLAAAADLLEAAAALSPEAPRPAAMLGRVLAAIGQPARAETVLAQAAALAPDDPQPRNDRAAMLLRMQRHREARDILQDTLRLHGPDPVLLCNLANATLALGEQDEAVALARQAIRRAPDAALAHRTLCNSLPYQTGASGGGLLAAAQDCAARLPRSKAPAWTNTPDPERRLRVGLLSGCLKIHPVGWLTIAGLEALDRRGFALVCLAQNGAHDPIARRFRAIAEEWHEVAALDDAALAALARARGLDLLLELGGYGEAGRMPACAHHLAPVQIKWVGMQNHSTGLPEIGWFLTDRWETPPGFERFYSERLLRLPDGYVCYSPPAHAPEVGPLPARANGFVTFGCFNNLAKITPEVIATWSRILRALPDARMILKTHQFSDPETRAAVAARFAAEGVDPGRFELQGASNHRRFLAEYNRVDVVLDPFPYAGGLTTCEALWMGVPVLALPGETFASRHSTSHLCNVGLADWVAADRRDYVARALARAGDLDALAALRASLRERVRRSPLIDVMRFGRGLGSALRHAWRSWCADQAASSANSRSTEAA